VLVLWLCLPLKVDRARRITQEKMYKPIPCDNYEPHVCGAKGWQH